MPDSLYRELHKPTRLPPDGAMPRRQVARFASSSYNKNNVRGQNARQVIKLLCGEAVGDNTKSMQVYQMVVWPSGFQTTIRRIV